MPAATTVRSQRPTTSFAAPLQFGLRHKRPIAKRPYKILACHGTLREQLQLSIDNPRLSIDWFRGSAGWKFAHFATRQQAAASQGASKLAHSKKTALECGARFALNQT